MAAKRPHKLIQASAYFRVAAKFDRARQYKQAEHYRNIAERLVRENRAEAEARRAREAADKAWKKSRGLA